MRRHHRRQLRHHRRHDLDEHDGRHGDCISTASSPTLGSISCCDIFATLTQSCTSSSCWNGTTCLDGTTLTRRHIPIWTIPMLRNCSSRLEGLITNLRRTSTATTSSSFVGARTTNLVHRWRPFPTASPMPSKICRAARHSSLAAGQGRGTTMVKKWQSLMQYAWVLNLVGL